MLPPEFIQKNISGTALSGLGVGGTVAFFLETIDPLSIEAAQTWATAAGLPVIVTHRLVIVSANGYAGLLIRDTPGQNEAPVWLPPTGTTSSVAELIAEAGMAGQVLGGLTIPRENPERILNDGTATVDHVVQLLSKVKQQVRDKLGVQLQENFVYIGF